VSFTLNFPRGNPKIQPGGLVHNRRYLMTSFVRIWRPFGLRCLTFRRKLGTFERSKDCDSRTVPETDPCTPPMDPRCDPCPPWSSPRPPCPPPEPPTYHPHAGNVGNSSMRVSRTFPINSRLGAPGILRCRDLGDSRLEL